VRRGLDSCHECQVRRGGRQRWSTGRGAGRAEALEPGEVEVELKLGKDALRGPMGSRQKVHENRRAAEPAMVGGLVRERQGPPRTTWVVEADVARSVHAWQQGLLNDERRHAGSKGVRRWHDQPGGGCNVPNHKHG